MTTDGWDHMTSTTMEAPGATRLLPWEGLSTGTVAPGESLTSDELLTRAELDWDVETRPMWRRMRSGEFVQDRSDLEVFRTDTEDKLGTVRGRYELFKNTDAFAFGDELTKEGNARWAHAGQQGNGRKVFMTMELGEGFTALGEDVYKLYLLLRTSHDGSTKIRVDVVPFRMFCLNQSNLANTTAVSSWSIYHTQKATGRIAEAREALKLSHAYVEEFIQVADKLALIRVSDDQVRRVIESTIPTSRHRRATIVADVLNTYTSSPTVEPYRGTAYGALQATTEYFDHIHKKRNPNSRFESIMTGEGAAARNTVARNLLDLAA